MSDFSDNATVRILLADYVVADPQGKLNIIGGNIAIVGVIPDTGLTNPFGVIALVSVPPERANSEAALEVLLEDSAGNLVGVPGPTGQPQILRVGQNVTFEEKNLAAMGVPRKSLSATTQIVLMFSAGLPLALGRRYVWRVRLDGVSNPSWTAEMFVPGPPTGPVIG